MKIYLVTCLYGPSKGNVYHNIETRGELATFHDEKSAEKYAYNLAIKDTTNKYVVSKVVSSYTSKIKVTKSRRN